MSRWPRRRRRDISRSIRPRKTPRAPWAGRSKNTDAAGHFIVTSDTTAAFSLLNAGAVRTRAHRMLDLGLSDQLKYFRIDLDRLDAVVDRVLATTKEAYPGFDVPFHSRWRHFVVGDTDRWAAIADAGKW